MLVVRVEGYIWTKYFSSDWEPFPSLSLPPHRDREGGLSRFSRQFSRSVMLSCEYSHLLDRSLSRDGGLGLEHCTTIVQRGMAGGREGRRGDTTVLLFKLKTRQILCPTEQLHYCSSKISQRDEVKIRYIYLSKLYSNLSFPPRCSSEEHKTES